MWAMRVCILARRCFAFCLLLESFCFLECRLDKRLSCLSRVRSALGLSNILPSERVASVFTPRSMPRGSPFAFVGFLLASKSIIVGPPGGPCMLATERELLVIQIKFSFVASFD